jgi:hypothetical protein
MKQKSALVSAFHGGSKGFAAALKKQKRRLRKTEKRCPPGKFKVKYCRKKTNKKRSRK